MRRTLAAIAMLGFSGAASAAPAEDSETERATLLRTISEGTAAIAAAAACGVEQDHIDRATGTQSDLIRAAAVRIGHADPGGTDQTPRRSKRIREGVERQRSSAHCDTAIAKFELMFQESPRDAGVRPLAGLG
jgi:hypothetical protein